MNKPLTLTLAALMCASAVTASAADTATPTKTKSAKPAASPDWLIVEEDIWVPLRFEPLESLDSIRYHFRRNEEKAASNQIDKAVSWLKLAEIHALPITKEKLTIAEMELTSVAKDLRAGDTIDAAKMDASLAKAAAALGEWHYYKAKESWGKDEAKDAGRDLQLAAQYLQHAANSAHYQFGPDTISITKWYSPGVGTTTYDHNTLGKHLDGVEKALQELGTVLKK